MEKEIRKLKEKINKIQDVQKEMISMISHDLKTPLTTVIGFSHIIKQKPDLSEDTRKKCIDAVIHESERMLKMLNNLLTWQQIENHSVKISIETVNLKPLLLSLIKDYEDKINNQGILIKLNIEEDLKLKGDPDRLKEIMENILDNAVKYTGKDGLIKLKACKVEHTVINILLSDNGTGIKEELKSNIFKKTEPLRGLRGDKGLGLGLFISRELVEMHKGKIYFESSPEGSTFYIELPAI